MKNLKLYAKMLEKDFKNIKLYNDEEIKIAPYNDFKKVIKVFKEPPFLEELTEDDMAKEYMGYIENGLPIGFYKNGKIKSFCGWMFEIEEEHLAYLNFNQNDKIGYLYGIATLKEAREKGYGSLLMIVSLNFFKNIGVDYAYLRTQAEGSMSSPIAKKMGFKDLTDEQDNLIIQNVSEEYTGKFMTINMEKYKIKDISKKLVRKK